jgi:hypothetical protein
VDVEVLDHVVSRVRCKKNAPFLSVFLCLSRVCLGKWTVFSITMAQKRMFFAPEGMAAMPLSSRKRRETCAGDFLYL